MMKSKWVRLIVVLFVVIFGWRIYVKISSAGDKEGAGGGPGGQRGKQAVAVEIGKTAKMDMNDTGTFSGTLIAKNKFIVAPKVSGQLKKLFVNIGDPVKKGQIIAQLDERLYKQEHEKAKAALEMAKATAIQTQDALEISEKELVKEKALLEKNYISQTEYDQANSLFITNRSKNNVAQANVLSSTANLKSAEIELSDTKITADWSDAGQYRVIGEKFVDEGTMLNTGSSIVSIMDINTLIAVIDIIESDYSKIKIGQEAIITTDSYPDEKFRGKIARIAPLLQEASRQARVEIEITNPQNKMKPGMFAKVMISYQQKKNVTVVPLAAICKSKGETGIYTINKKEMKAKFIKVEIGIQSPEFVEIISPMVEGDVVILGQDQLENGKKISLPKAEGKKSGKQRKE